MLETERAFQSQRIKPVMKSKAPTLLRYPLVQPAKGSRAVAMGYSLNQSRKTHKLTASPLFPICCAPV